MQITIVRAMGREGAKLARFAAARRTFRRPRQMVSDPSRVAQYALSIKRSVVSRQSPASSLMSLYLRNPWQFLSINRNAWAEP